MVDVKIDKLKHSVLMTSKGVKLNELSLDDKSYGQLMRELIAQSGVSIDYMRKITKLFQVKSYEFKGVKR